MNASSSRRVRRSFAHLFFTPNPPTVGFPRCTPPIARVASFVASLSVTLAKRPKSGLESSSNASSSSSSSSSRVARAGEGVDSTTESVVVAVVGSVDSVVAGHARSGVAHGRDMRTSRDVTHWFPSVWVGGVESGPARRSPSSTIGLLPLVFTHDWMIGRRRLRLCVYASMRVSMRRACARRRRTRRRGAPRARATKIPTRATERRWRGTRAR